MKTIKWVLPFSNIDYLQSLTEDLVENPSVILITGIQDREGNIAECNITFKELEGVSIEEAILYTGAAIGAHCVDYALAMKEQEEAKKEFFAHVQNMFDNLFRVPCIQEEQEEVLLLTENAGEVVIVEEKEEELVEEVIKENVKNPITKKQIEAVITKTTDSKAKAMLRRVLKNFKKSIV